VQDEFQVAILQPGYLQQTEKRVEEVAVAAGCPEQVSVAGHVIGQEYAVGVTGVGQRDDEAGPLLVAPEGLLPDRVDGDKGPIPAAT
jgi:hypothetical protein